MTPRNREIDWHLLRDRRHQLSRHCIYIRERLSSSIPMSSSQPSHLLQVLKATLSQVESSTEWSQDDPSVIELKRILLARIADLELLGALASPVARAHC